MVYEGVFICRVLPAKRCVRMPQTTSRPVERVLSRRARETA